MLLALHRRSERQPLLFLGPLSNPAMGIWGVGDVVLAALAATLPVLRETLKVSSIAPQERFMVAAALLVTTSWWEAWKLLHWSRG